MSNGEDDIENMSDEDFMNMEPPKLTNNPVEEDKDEGVSAGSNDEDGQEDDGNSDDSEDDAGTDGGDGSKESDDESEPKVETKTNPLGDSDEDEPKKSEKPKTSIDDKKKVEKPAEEKQDEKTKPSDSVKSENKEAEQLNYEALYKEIMKPFKANGKEISLSNPAEAVQLMQMGANYTKKMQALQPVLRVAKMLENNGLMDEGKLGYLIDLHRKDPEAIKKLVKDAGIDPMDMDTSKESQYKPKNYSVSEKQMSFDTALQDVTMSDIGKKTVVMINKEWDKASKEVLYSNPEVLRYITDQKESGIYDQIADEVNRQRMLGYLTDKPFISAYKEVGEVMQRNGFLKVSNQAPAPAQQAQVAPVQQQAPQKQVLATGTSPRKVVSDNGDKARAASPVKTAPKAVKPDYNPLAMSDEDFEKNANLARRL